MGYYTRVLTTNERCVPISVLRAALKESGSSATLHSDGASDREDWEQLTLTNSEGQEIALIERNPIEEGSLGESELQDFEDDLEGTLPESSVVWLRQFFPRVRRIYAFQHLSGSHSDEGFAALQSVRTSIWAQAPAILQADCEGFSNEGGYHITWEFSDSVTGNWWMGLLRDGKWVHFQMDLGSPAHRQTFKRGLVPEGVKLA
jgi:hypothetical protein